MNYYKNVLAFRKETQSKQVKSSSTRLQLNSGKKLLKREETTT